MIKRYCDICNRVLDDSSNFGASLAQATDRINDLESIVSAKDAEIAQLKAERNTMPSAYGIVTAIRRNDDGTDSIKVSPIRAENMDLAEYMADRRITFKKLTRPYPALESTVRLVLDVGGWK